MLVLAMEFSRDATTRRSLKTEQEQSEIHIALRGDDAAEALSYNRPK